MRKGKNTWVLIIIFIATLAILILNVYQFYRKEHLINPSASINLDANHAYNFYLAGKPNIFNRSYYGSEKASITMIAFLEPNSEASSYFLNEIFPQIERDYINTSKVRFYAKHYLTLQDLNSKNENYLDSAMLGCIEKLDKNNYYSFYFDLLRNHSLKQTLIERYKINDHLFNECMDTENSDLMNDMAEVEEFGISGVAPKFYIGLKGTDNIVIDGVPSYARFRQTMRLYSIRVGD